MNEQELEDRIWNNTKTWINFTKLHAKVHGDKQTCFHKTSSMIDTSQLIMRENMKEKLVKRTDFDNTTEFEDIMKFQENRLLECRLELMEYKKPFFNYKDTIIQAGFNEQLVMDMLKLKKKDRKMTKKQIEKKYGKFEEIKIWKPYHWIITKHLERMLIYTNALLLFISRANMQRTLGIITKSESKRRIEEIEKVLDNHFKNLEIETKDDYAGIRQWFELRLYKIEHFKI